MTRKEEIENKASDYIKGSDKLYGYKPDFEDIKIAFISGAEWADKHSVLDMEDVDFDEEFNKYHIGLYNPFNSGAEIREFAKYFFELGLKVRGRK